MRPITAAASCQVLRRCPPGSVTSSPDTPVSVRGNQKREPDCLIGMGMQSEIRLRTMADVALPHCHESRTANRPGGRGPTDR